MNDPVRVTFKAGNAVYETTVERQYAEDNAETYTVLDGAEVYAHGRLKGVTKKDGRPLKPAADIPKSIPGEPADPTSEPGDKAGGKSKE